MKEISSTALKNYYSDPRPGLVIRGSGYGDSHAWSQPSDINPFYPIGFGGAMIHPIGGPTGYRCLKCGIEFLHHYHDEPDIFEAIKQAGIPDKCVKLTYLQRK